MQQKVRALVRVAILTCLVLLAMTPTIKAQQQVVNVPTSAAGAAWSMSATTTYSTTAIAVPTTNTGSANVLTGNHDIYGYQFVNASTGAGDTCWLQIFDTTLAAVSVGTTRARFAIPILSAASSVGYAPFPNIGVIPLFNMTSTLVVAATSTPTGSSACAGGSQTTIGHFLYK